MERSEQKKISKFLSFILRHKPEAIGLTLDDNGWADIDELIAMSNASGEAVKLSRTAIDAVVRFNDKRRFAISEDGKRIRAVQGHSIQVDLQLKPAEPPEHLYHGTATRFLESILAEGLKPQQRQYVHLSRDVPTATGVGQRYGKPVVLTVQARRMHERGYAFYLADNGVWLTGSVPVEFIVAPPKAS
jgi:putative RNA 2'-phosphotransferase